MKFNKLSVAQTIAVHELMKQHCAKVDGYAIYANDWSDDRVQAETANPEPDRKISVHAVAGVRMKMFGRFKRNMVATTNSEQLVALQARVTKLEDELQATQDWMKKVADWVNRNVKAYSPPPGKQVSSPPGPMKAHVDANQGLERRS